MVTAETLLARKEEIAASPDLSRLAARLTARAAPVLERMPPIPAHKALLSKDGGICPRDGTPLSFDPFSPNAQRCPRCGEVVRGDRHERSWARYQHLWLAERAAHLATLAVLTDNETAGTRAAELLRAYGERYLGYANTDNVLGPSRLFFSTYLESIWLCNYLSAALILREGEQLDEVTARAVGQVADEAANLIGEFDEGFSNRQTWNNAALTAIAVWFEDVDLARRAIESPSGLIAHLARGFGPDGLWYEGENYHLFALRAWLIGAGWAREAGIELLDAPEAARRLQAALRAPALTALPDCTYPARKDSRFGVSLAQPAYIELWEVGLAALLALSRAEAAPAPELWSWLRALHAAPPVTPELMESYLQDAPFNGEPLPHGRADLSWWALLTMVPELPQETEPWAPRSGLLETQGFAVLRHGSRYAGLECGPSGGGHAHADRLNLIYSGDGTYWLPDIGTGSYVAQELFWYRGTLAHNAPRLDGTSQSWGDATCEAFETRDAWSWARGRFGELSRIVVLGPQYLLDVCELTSREEHTVDLPWHLRGADVVTPGTWGPESVNDEFVSGVERFTPSTAEPGSLVLEAADGARRLRAHVITPGPLLRMEGPPRPREHTRERFLMVRARGRAVRSIAVLESGSTPVVRSVRVRGDVIEIDTTGGLERHVFSPAGWSVETQSGFVRLGGRRPAAEPFRPLLEIDAPVKARAQALRIAEPPPLDGSLAGFDVEEPLVIDTEDQYRRSEEPYPGPEELSATAYVNWTEDALYVAVEVTKPELSFRPRDAAPLGLDNETDDIHSDGVQIYFQEGEGGDILGFLVVPEEAGRLRVHPVTGTAARTEQLVGAWARTDTGYRITARLALSEAAHVHVGGRYGFDILVNEMRDDRLRRAGQLVWSGGNGWVWLRGDRQSQDRFGVLELIG